MCRASGPRSRSQRGKGSQMLCMRTEARFSASSSTSDALHIRTCQNKSPVERWAKCSRMQILYLTSNCSLCSVPRKLLPEVVGSAPCPGSQDTYSPTPSTIHGQSLPRQVSFFASQRKRSWSLSRIQYRQAAENAKKAGFDGVELHGGSGYLPHQFLDSTANQRTDNWGGSPHNRQRFVVETIKALAEVYDANRVGIKLDPGGGYNDVGMPLAETLDTFSALIKELVRMNIAYVQLVRCADADPDQANEGTMHDVLASYGPLVKHASSSTLLVLNGQLTPTEADGLIRDGKIDAASFGEAWINNPDLQKRVEAGAALASDLDAFSLYGFVENPAIGYTDYPTAV
jgi:hypothetical protein